MNQTDFWGTATLVDSGGENTGTCGVRSYVSTPGSYSSVISALYTDLDGTTTGVRSIPGQIDMFNGSSFTGSSANIATFSTSTILFFSSLDFNGANGVLARNVTNATTTGSTTLSYSDCFRTIINTPSAAGRIFVLPAPGGGVNAGKWWEICNKSAAQIITIQSSGGVTLATISATTAGGAGNVARIGINSAGTDYFRTQ